MGEVGGLPKATGSDLKVGIRKRKVWNGKGAGLVLYLAALGWWPGGRPIQSSGIGAKIKTSR